MWNWLLEESGSSLGGRGWAATHLPKDHDPMILLIWLTHIPKFYHLNTESFFPENLIYAMHYANE